MAVRLPRIRLPLTHCKSAQLSPIPKPLYAENLLQS
jgi:hypothetical protein